MIFFIMVSFLSCFAVIRAAEQPEISNRICLVYQLPDAGYHNINFPEIQLPGKKMMNSDKKTGVGYVDKAKETSLRTEKRDGF